MILFFAPSIFMKVWNERTLSSNVLASWKTEKGFTTDLGVGVGVYILALDILGSNFILQFWTILRIPESKDKFFSNLG
uniref:Uncharacterized protein n=1 Tax=Vitis vinifera TaxID=29760 RepID=F6HT73_VITVI